jgi:sec-independent protein translocase protein TatC
MEAISHVSSDATQVSRAWPTIVPVSWRRIAVYMVTALTAAAQEMSFVDHLDELRRRILWAIACVAVTFAGCWFFAGDLLDIASAPIRANPTVTLSVSRPQDIFALQMRVTLVASLFLSSPLLLTQAWLFISPGLYRHERRYAIPFILSASVLFVAGGAFGYYVAFPTALKFLLDWIVESKLTPIIDAVEYFDLFFSILVALGIVFQIPAVIFVLSRIGLLTARTLVRYFKHAVLGSVIVAAVITPTTDFANMLVIAGPMIALYVVGIGVAWVFGRRRVENPGRAVGEVEVDR